MKVKRTEYGWAGHYIQSGDCRFRRNTLLEYGDLHIIVSTVGNLQDSNGKSYRIQTYHYYETKVFDAIEYQSGVYIAWNEIKFDSRPKYITEITPDSRDSDVQANKMHERVVREIMGKLRKGQIIV